ncbi:voltage-gated purine nucleotide uniporter SLC17A9-like [Saccoglossus kowalevskii]|uniref:Solute carrier family 17 member 9-like n=1 Tax=Saccoglossus kowalevskii TaxID=10224 RepID=A0ABM0GXN0_SACKO|nr:PREDICTED: solute carrier family 17 member 9-like [Saccoglossus kowalevskii]
MVTELWSRREKNLWTLALFVGTVLNFAARNSFPLSAVEISKELNWDKRDTGLVLSCFYWGYASTQILSGWLSDKYGGDQVVTMATFIWGALTLLMPLLVYLFEIKSQQLRFLVCFRILFAATQAFHYPAVASILSTKVSDNSKSRTYSTVMSGTSAGNVLSGSVGSLLLMHYGWHSVFYTFGFLSLAWALVVRLYLMKVNRSEIPLAHVNGAKDIKKSITPKKTIPWGVLFRHPAFWAMIFGRFCLNYVFHLLFSWLPTYFTEKFPDQKGYVFNVIPWLLCVPSSILSGYIADYIISYGYSVTVARKCLHTLECGGVVMCLLAISYSHDFSTAIFFATSALVFQSFGLAGVFANPQDIAPDFTGAVFGLMNTAGAIPGFIGVYVAGHILEYSHSWPFVYMTTACVSFTGWLIFMVFGSGEKII